MINIKMLNIILKGAHSWLSFKPNVKIRSHLSSNGYLMLWDFFLSLHDNVNREQIRSTVKMET